MPILSLCTGYKGLDTAVEALTGDKTAYFAEVDPAACLVLQHHWPEVPNIGDITAYDFTQLADEIDTITAGFSCQDISNAGPREGIGGDRSRIWKDVCRAIRDIRPRHAFLENVAAIRSRGLNVVAEDLAAVGYDLWWTTLRASEVGGGHTSETDGSGSRFPTPKASDGPHGGPNQRSSKGKYDALPGMVVNCLPLLKTPTAQLGTNGAAQHPDKRRGGGTGQPSMTRSPSFFPTPTAADGTGGPGTSPNRKGGMNLRTAVTHLPSGGPNTSPPSADGSS